MAADFGPKANLIQAVVENVICVEKHIKICAFCTLNSYSDFVTIFLGKASSYTIREAEKLAKQVLEMGGYEDIVGPTPIVKIAEQFGFTTFEERTLPENVSGNIYVGGTTWDIYNTDKVIVVGEDEEFFHQRFIIAHELAHYLMDYLGSDISQKQSILFSRDYPKSDHDSEVEIRADRFAAELLMPAKEFARQYIKAMEVSDYNKRYAVAYLSNFFRTKRSSIERRIEEVIL